MPESHIILLFVSIEPHRKHQREVTIFFVRGNFGQALPGLVVETCASVKVGYLLDICLAEVKIIP